MSDVNAETLQDLMERRLKELGQRRGRGEQISLHEAYDRMVEKLGEGAKPPTYEVFRRIRTQGHNRLSDRTADALATMLEVDVNVVLEAAGERKRLGPFQLPSTADRLNEAERAAVLGVVDAILQAGGRGNVRPLTKREQMQQIPGRAARSTD